MKARGLGRSVESLRLAARARRFQRSMTLRPRDDLVEHGSRGYGFWVVPSRLLGRESRCYLVGVGEDISFDLALIARYGCTVHAFDPVPAAAAHAAVAAAHEPRFHFHAVGLWSGDTTLPLHAPMEEGYVSHSATNLHGTRKAFDAPFRSVASLMSELGHDAIDLLKISAEGSEYEILDSIANDAVEVGVICVEFAQPAPTGASERAVDQLIGRGYDPVHARVTPWTWKLTFVHRSLSMEVVNDGVATTTDEQPAIHRLVADESGHKTEAEAPQEEDVA